MRRILISILSCVVLIALLRGQTRTLDFKRIDYLLDSLSVFAGGYPPNVENESQSANVTKLFSLIDAELGTMANPGTTAEIELRFGILYRYGHNLDVDSAWKTSEFHLKRAISLDERFRDPCYELGLLYVNTGFEYATQAEMLFKKALDLSPDDHFLPAHQGLAFAYYYQGKPEKAIQELNIVLGFEPDNKQAIRMKQIFQEVINRKK